jgi:hypothetical protein
MGECRSRPRSDTPDPIISKKPEEKIASLDCGANSKN